MNIGHVQNSNNGTGLALIATVCRCQLELLYTIEQNGLALRTVSLQMFLAAVGYVAVSPCENDSGNNSA